MYICIINLKNKLTAYFIKNNIVKENIKTIAQAFCFRKIDKNKMILQEQKIFQHIYFITKEMFCVYGVFQRKKEFMGFFMKELIQSIFYRFIKKNLGNH